MSILIVDDSRLMRALLKNILNDIGCADIYEAANGAEAVGKAHIVNPGIVFMNLVMPEMDGYQASRHILKDFPNTKVIMMTSNRQYQKNLNSDNVNIYDYIDVPFEPNKIKELILKTEK